jgi:two-component system chemotaxis response regulator CheY
VSSFRQAIGSWLLVFGRNEISFYTSSMNFRFAVIDDAPFIRELLKQLATQAGGVCIGEAETGTGGLELVRRFLPDVIFLDLVMPGKNGLEIIAETKLIWPELKIIACSTLDDEKTMSRARALGVDVYLTKPFTQAQITSALERLLNGSALRSEIDSAKTQLGRKIQ